MNITKVTVALVGDYDSSILAHLCIPKAIDRAAGELNISAETKWIGTTSLAKDACHMLRDYNGIWCVPGSPYAHMQGALDSIQHAREQGVPFLGTCGGFQHALIEYARNVLGLTEADHEESNPGSCMPIIHRMKCSIVEGAGTLRLIPGSRLASIYGKGCIVERYNCNFGFNPLFTQSIFRTPLRQSAITEEGEIRAFELDTQSHAFFLGTLFQPERSVLQPGTHPLIMAFLQAALQKA